MTHNELMAALFSIPLESCGEYEISAARLDGARPRQLIVNAM